MPEVTFLYHTGIEYDLFRDVRLTGNWTPDGRHADQRQSVGMERYVDESGCIAYRTAVNFSEPPGTAFSWSVVLDAPGRPGVWGMPTETGAFDAPECYRTFALGSGNSCEEYHLTFRRDLGANKYYRQGSQTPGIRFSVWAPHAVNAETVIAAADANGYIWNDGRGAGETFPMRRDGQGVWRTSPDDPALGDYGRLEHAHYMFRITREDGSVVYRTDIYSRCQAGKGGVNPEKADWDGQALSLESTKSCSVVKDMDRVNEADGAGDEAVWTDSQNFWRHEFSFLRPLPSQLPDLVIYEMHIAGLWSGAERPGSLREAMAMLDYLTDLGVNVVELLPVSEFENGSGWGYGSSHFHAIKYDRERQDLFRRFVRECHRRGIAVFADVVYNHYTPDSERVFWMYDAVRHDRNMYYYYHGKQEEYPGDFPEGGYSDNYSTGYLPNVAEEMVRKMMIDSAVALLLEYHIDGFRMDLTQALHSFNVLHKDGSPLPEANENGIRFMREWARTLRLIKPGIFLIAEDHSGWSMIDRQQFLGGVGFSAVWWSEWYHQLIGDATEDDSKARLLKNAGYGTAKPLRMNAMTGMLAGSPANIVYNASHDECGNSAHSARNIEVAVNGMLFDNTRFWAEARCRVVTGMTVLSAGTPMFFMGEEVCASKPYRYNDFLANREDYAALRDGSGGNMYRYYRDLIRLRRENAGLRSTNIAVLKANNAHRVIAWHRWFADLEFIVVASLNNTAFEDYAVTHRNLRRKVWLEALNSDAVRYGGAGMHTDQERDSSGGTLHIRLPACGLVVMARKY